MTLPANDAPIKAVWAIFDRGQDYLKWYEDRQIRAFAHGHQLALVLVMQCRSKEREDMIVLPEKGVGRALFAALDQFADASGRQELKSAGIVAMGWSGAGSLVGRLAGYRPERYVAGIAHAPGQYEPLGMDTIELSDQAARSPQLIIANGGDNERYGAAVRLLQEVLRSWRPLDLRHSEPDSSLLPAECRASDS